MKSCIEGNKKARSEITAGREGESDADVHESQINDKNLKSPEVSESESELSGTSRGSRRACLVQKQVVSS